MCFRVSESVFPLEVVYGAAFGFLERAYVRLERVSDGELDVSVKAQAGEALSSRELCGELSNELLNQCIRQRLGDRTAKVREVYLARSFANRGAALESLLAELDDVDLEGDALEVPVAEAGMPEESADDQ